MTNIQKAFIWAAIIIATAIFMQMKGMDDGSSLGVIGGMTIFALKSGVGCGKGCLQ